MSQYLDTDDGQMKDIPDNARFVLPMPGRKITKLEATPTFGPEDLRTLAGDAIRMQDALIAVVEVLKRRAPAGQSLSIHQAHQIRDIHKAVNLPDSNSGLVPKCRQCLNQPVANPGDMCDMCKDAR